MGNAIFQRNTANFKANFGMPKFRVAFPEIGIATKIAATVQRIRIIPEACALSTNCRKSFVSFSFIGLVVQETVFSVLYPWIAYVYSSISFIQSASDSLKNSAIEKRGWLLKWREVNSRRVIREVPHYPWSIWIAIYLIWEYSLLSLNCIWSASQNCVYLAVRNCACE